MNPKVSVLVAVYRTPPEILRATIRSVLGQTFGDFELLLLDDCPDDPREEVVREFGDSRIVYAKNERNRGISPTRNRLLDMAKGDYCAVLDHDDLCRSDRLEKEVAWLETHPECGLVASYVRHIPGDRVVGRPISDHKIMVCMAAGNPLAHSSMMLRMSVLRQGNIRYESKYSPTEDYRLMFRLMGLTTFHCIPEPLLDYREHESNTTGNQYGRMLRKACRIRNDVQIEYPDLFDELMDEFGPSVCRRAPVPIWFLALEKIRVWWVRHFERKRGV